MSSCRDRLNQDLMSFSEHLIRVQEQVEKLEEIKFKCEDAIFKLALESAPEDIRADIEAIAANFNRVSISLNPSDEYFDEDLSQLVQKTMDSLNRMLPDNKDKKALLKEQFVVYEKIVKYYLSIKWQADLICNGLRKYNDDCINYVESVDKIIRPIYSILNGVPTLDNIDDYCSRANSDASYFEILEDVANQLAEERFQQANLAVSLLAKANLPKIKFDKMEQSLKDASNINLSIIGPGAVSSFSAINKDLTFQFSVALPIGVSPFFSEVNRVESEVDIMKSLLVESKARFKNLIKDELMTKIKSKVALLADKLCEDKLSSINSQIKNKFLEEIKQRLFELGVKKLPNQKATEMLNDVLGRYKILGDIISQCDEYQNHLTKSTGSIGDERLPKGVGFDVTVGHKLNANRQIKTSIIDAIDSSAALISLRSKVDDQAIKYVLTANRDGFGTRLLKGILLVLSFGQTAKKPGMWKSHGAIHAEKLESIVNPANGCSRN